MTAATDRSRLVQLAMIGAVAGAIGQDALRDLSTVSLLISSGAFLAAVLAWARSPWRPRKGAPESVLVTVVGAVVGAIATTLGDRAVSPLSRNMKLVVLAVIAAMVVAIVLYVQRRRRLGAMAEGPSA